MDSDLPSPIEESNEQKAEFRKLTNEAAHRKYRRRSPMAGLSDDDGSPKHGHRSRRDSKESDYERRNDERGDDRLSSGSQHGHRNDSYRHSSRGQNSRADTHYDSKDRESNYNRSRDRHRDVDRYSRDRSDIAVKKYKEKESSSGRSGYDGRHGSRYDDRDRYARDKDHRDDKRDYKNSRYHRSDRTTSYEDSLGQRSDFKSKWDNVKDVDASNCDQDSKFKYDPSDRHDVKLNMTGRKAELRSGFVSEDVAAKKPKISSSEDTEARKVDEISGSKLMTDQATVNDSVVSVDAAKVAAMKAAELVNKNLTSTGVMTADQKKKLLWGSKKSTPTEESSHRWDSAMFSDRERQEKFNKLMGVKGEVKAISKPVSSQDTEKLQVDLEKQYTAGLRRRDGRTVGLGL